MSIAEMKARRGALIQQARGITASAVGRDLTADEKRRFDEAMAEFDRLGQAIEREERTGAAEAELGQRTSEAIRPDPGMGGGFETFGPPVIALRADQQLRERVQAGPRLSLGRYMRGLVTGRWEGAADEHRAMTEGSQTGGGFLVPDTLSAEIIDAVRGQAVCVNAGARTVPLQSGSQKMVRVVNDPLGTWRPELVPIPSSDLTFDLIEFQPRTLATLLKASVELFEDAGDGNLEELIRDTIAGALALELDRAALAGSGIGSEPRGILNTPGVNVVSMGTNGGVVTAAMLSLAVSEVQARNGQPNAVVYAPRTAGALDRLVATDNQPLQAFPSVAPLKKFVTTSLPITQTQGTASNASSAIVGAFSGLLIGVRTKLTIEVSRVGQDSDVSAFRDLAVLIRGYLRADVQVSRPEHFAVVQGIIPA